MAKKYLTLAGLTTYDSLLKEYIGEADAKAIKYGKIEDGVLKLYKVENPAADTDPDFAMTLPEGALDVELDDPDDDQVLMYDADRQQWVNANLTSICFTEAGSNDVIIDGGNASDLT